MFNGVFDSLTGQDEAPIHRLTAGAHRDAAAGGLNWLWHLIRAV
jgi:hypothetical protein